MGKETHWRGFTELGSEVTQQRRDWHECVDIMNEHEADDPRVLSGMPLHGPNLWPSQPAAFKPVVRAYFDEMKRVGAAVMEGMSLSCGLPRDHFARRFTSDPWCVLRLLHYPPREADEHLRPSSGDGGAYEIGIGIGEHTDYGCLTLLLSNEPGLSVKTPDGRWLDASPRHGQLVCNLGDAMQTWTYGAYKATPHRVITSGERISVPFFYEPNFEAMIEPLEAFRRPGMAEIAPIRYGAYLLSAYQRSYPEIHRP